MRTFKFDIGSSLHVVRETDSVKLRFEGNTLGFNATSDGFSISNDWNSRHFTLSFDENSILYHLTREDIDDRESGKGDIPPSEFAAEIYGYIRSIAPPVPKDRLGELGIVGRVDFDELRTYLEEKGIVDDTTDGLCVDPDRKKEVGERLDESHTKRGELYARVLDPVPIEEATDEDSGENIFVYPRVDEIFLLFVFPDGYVGVTTIRSVMNFASIAGGSQMMDHVLRSISGE